MKVLAVGDIHTKTFIIDRVEKLIDQYDAIIFCGDYADDYGKEAPDSIAAWDRLWKLQYKYPDKVKLVLGNHDYIYVNKTPTLQSGYNSITQLFINSPTNKYLRDWLLSLPIVEEIDGVCYSHAGITDLWDGEVDVHSLWRDDSPIWVRPSAISYGAKYRPYQVFGHTPSDSCWEVQENVWCIDTFSTYSDGTPIGDQTFLEIIDGKTFKKINSENSNDITSKSD